MVKSSCPQTPKSAGLLNLDLPLQVDDLDALLDRLIAAGVSFDPKRDTYDFGKFGWFTDPEGNRGELWQPLITLFALPLVPIKLYLEHLRPWFNQSNL